MTEELKKFMSIECADRAFANQCFSGTAIMDIDAVIEKYADDNTKDQWEWLKAGLAKMARR